LKSEAAPAATLRRTLAALPGDAESLRRIAGDQSGAAPTWWQRAAAVDSGCIVSRLRIADFHVRRRAAIPATCALNAVLALSPEGPAELFELAGLLKLGGLRWLAHAVYRRLLAGIPDHFEAWCNLANLDLAAGDHDAMRRASLRAHSLRPNDPLPLKKLLNLVLYTEKDPEKIHGHHLSAMRTLGLPQNKSGSLRSRPVRHPRRIGFVSSDFADHPVAWNVKAFFRHRRQADWHVTAYANVDAPDEVTDWYRGAVDQWRDIAGISHEMARSLIQADELDGLVFLAGRFNANWFFVRERLAPTQISFHDGATSASREIDYWITDRVLHPVESPEHFFEQLAKLPVFYNFDPPVPAPAVALRRHTDGGPLFGVFNNPAKITPFIVGLWSQLLRMVPSARIMFKYGNTMMDPSIRERVRVLFAAAGINEERLEFRGISASRADHLGRLGEVDVALDTFPFTGATTTFECLWMGVPVVTLAGTTFIQRAACSILAGAGLNELIAADPAEYVRIARDLVAATGQLEHFRLTLREQVARSPLCDGPGYAAALGDLFTELIA